MYPFLLIAAILIHTTEASSSTQNHSLFDRVKSGIRFAETFLKLDKASGIANLVSETFGNLTAAKNNIVPPGSGIITGFFKILGFNAKKIGAIAINALIFFAQLLGTSISIKPFSQGLKARDIKNIDVESPFSWMLENSKVIDMISHANDKNLPSHIIEYIRGRSLDEETGCIQLLVCRTAPFVWGMQKVLAKINANDTDKYKVRGRGKEIFFEYVPSVDQLQNQSDECERTNYYCIYD